MVCTLCLRYHSLPRSDGDCFDHLILLLKEHYSDREDRKNQEIKALRERLHRLEGRDRCKMSSISISSPTLFTQECPIAVGAAEEGDPLSVSTDLFNLTVQDGELKQEAQKKRPPPVLLSPMAKSSRMAPFKSPSRTGNWKTKPTRLSFSNLQVETQVLGPPKKQMKSLTIEESFIRAAKPKIEAKKRPIESVDLDDDEHGPRKALTLDESFNRAVNVEHAHLDNDHVPTCPPRLISTCTMPNENNDLDGFCDDCAEYFRLNPPQFTDREREKKLQDCEKHKLKKYKMHDTPVEFWKIDFGPTPDQMKTQVFRK